MWFTSALLVMEAKQSRHTINPGGIGWRIKRKKRLVGFSFFFLLFFFFFPITVVTDACLLFTSRHMCLLCMFDPIASKSQRPRHLVSLQWRSLNKRYRPQNLFWIFVIPVRTHHLAVVKNITLFFDTQKSLTKMPPRFTWNGQFDSPVENSTLFKAMFH